MRYRIMNVGKKSAPLSEGSFSYNPVDDLMTGICLKIVGAFLHASKEILSITQSMDVSVDDSIDDVLNANELSMKINNLLERKLKVVNERKR